ncbi:nuclear transport factor 2 family protein [Streptomyces sp. NPDC092369]|uniref:nuclear transport factor 2 family protein n=1 Tax=Streptomyces sp. NPDC092369 TaxID=3366015 RepID=UPI003808A787
MGAMTPAEMEALIETHMEAERIGDAELAVSMYTDDIEHDAVGWPGGPAYGIPAARERYLQLLKDFRSEKDERTHTYYSENGATVEDLITGVVPGSLLGIPGNNRRVTFRMLHVFEFKDGKIARENVWLDGAAIAAQLTAPEQVSEQAPR